MGLPVVEELEVYKDSIMSTIVDLALASAMRKDVYKDSIMSTIVDITLLEFCIF